MPEGPEVRRHADAVHAALAGKPITAFSARTRAAKAWLAEHPGAFVGRRVERVHAHGKHLIGRVEDGLYFHAHLMMWGSWRVVAPDDPLAAERDRRERARIAVEDAVALLFSAPVFDVGHGDPYDHLDRLATLGPDILPYEGPDAFDAGAFRRRLLQDTFADWTIGAALLNQRIAAGIGNYLRADMLFACRLDPWRRVADLTDADLACLETTIPALARRAYDHHRTVTEADQARMQRDPNLVYRPGSPWGTRHYTFRRTNLPCLRCDDVIRQLHQVTFETDDLQKKRIIYFCPTCQQTSIDVKPPKRRALRPAPAP